MRPKLEDVAKRANVSKTTVSRVLNNRGYLSQKTIDNVYKAIEELNYQPNVVARQLFQKKTNIVGLLFPTVANPFFSELVEALEKKLYEIGYKVLIGNSMNNKEKETNYLNQLLSDQVDGLIVGTHNQGIQEYKYQNLPIVAIDRVMNEDIPVVESDNYNGGKLATKLLIAQGAKNIIHTNGPIDLQTPANRRRLAYEDTMKAYQLIPRTVTLDFNISYVKKKQIFFQMFEDYPKIDGIFASNDIDAVLILQVAKEKGLNVPADLLVVGYDGTLMTRSILPDLTTVIQPINDIADTAVAILMKRINKEETKKEYILPVTLWMGKTSVKKKNN
ncbi:TPA: LacI family DNA-binding transcriptional regulator [Enterococcus faecium]|uniref:LacI family DNA-binding transcriptional regulator n=1 Tax=Enterococcus faecium TaxID=1352 RepID=UPI00100EB9E4|nr:LacI family DNA-binding transcriptional regulator [Enterococcus faecium]RXW34890.1 LacI family transcriptional regulator [Enterococcus faecium]RXW47459.1 LacI family transcriptional regulator [Enterococcus faecium]RXW54274.1 LacI family transcriptional regulator [Enterococcus faecium]RXW64796.1 LacI family transcriptional regulator [Enterococcus faecium]RXW68950.1 LacI family transcriptional regulator [Enterococcus faecium]